MLADVWTSFWMWPLYIMAFLLIVLLVFVVLGRIKGGKYLRPVIMAMTKVPFLRKGMMKASESAMRKQNPELASAIKKMERSGAMNDPMRAQQAMSRLSAAERRALLDATAQQQEQMPEPMNREQRRRLEKAKRDAQRRGGR
jgi:hypothetical protein